MEPWRKQGARTLVAHVYSLLSLVGARDGLTCRYGRREHIPPIHGAREHLLHDQDACKHLLQGHGAHEHLLHGLGVREYLLHDPGLREHLPQGHGQREHSLLSHSVRVHLMNGHVTRDSCSHGRAAYHHLQQVRPQRVHLALIHKHGAHNNPLHDHGARPPPGGHDRGESLLRDHGRSNQLLHGHGVRYQPPAQPSPRVGDAERSGRYVLRCRCVSANDAPIFSPEEPAAASDTTAEYKGVQAAPGVALLPHFVADEDAEDHDTSSRHLVALPFESATLSPEAVGQSADAQRPAGPLHDLSALARAAPTTPGCRKCGAPPPQGRWLRLTGGLNDKK